MTNCALSVIVSIQKGC